MINFTSLPHSVTAAIGAILISTVFIGAAVGPGISQASHNAPTAQASA